MRAAQGSDRRRQGVRFQPGQPEHPCAEAVRSSIERSLAECAPEELHGYTPAPGLPAARKAVAASLNRRFGTSYSMGDIFMTVGAAASVSCALHALASPGDEVIVVSPYFPEYKVWIESCGCTCVEAPAKPYTFPPVCGQRRGGYHVPYGGDYRQFAQQPHGLRVFPGGAATVGQLSERGESIANSPCSSSPTSRIASSRTEPRFRGCRTSIKTRWCATRTPSRSRCRASAWAGCSCRLRVSRTRARWLQLPARRAPWDCVRPRPLPEGGRRLRG